MPPRFYLASLRISLTLRYTYLSITDSTLLHNPDCLIYISFYYISRSNNKNAMVLKKMKSNEEPLSGVG